MSPCFVRERVGDRRRLTNAPARTEAAAAAALSARVPFVVAISSVFPATTAARTTPASCRDRSPSIRSALRSPQNSTRSRPSRLPDPDRFVGFARPGSRRRRRWRARSRSSSSRAARRPRPRARCGPRPPAMAARARRRSNGSRAALLRAGRCALSPAGYGESTTKAYAPPTRAQSRDALKRDARRERGQVDPPVAARFRTDVSVRRPERRARCAPR